MADIQSAMAEIRRGKKKTEEERRRKKPRDEHKMSASATQGGHNNYGQMPFLKMTYYCVD